MKRSRINPVSKNKKKRNQLYERSKKEYWAAIAVEQGRDGRTPLCEKCLERTATDTHHRAGRSGPLLWCKDYLSVLCRPCHSYGPDSVHENPKKAELDGWTVRLNRREIESIKLREESKLYE